MTLYEHAMIGINGTLAAGLRRRHGWQIVALAGFAAMLPDWDGLTLLLGPSLYADGHRCWGHNLLVDAVVATVVSAVAYYTDAPTRVRRWLAKRSKAFEVGSERMETRPYGYGELGLWIVVGLVAAYSHLVMDLLFSAGKNLPVWGVPLFWPFTCRAWAYPLVSWGSIGPTVILATSMFAMIRWQKSVQTIAAGSLLLVAAYMVLCGTCFPPGS